MQKLLQFYLLTIIIISLSCDSKTNSSTTMRTDENAAANQSGSKGEGIIGEWEQEYTVFDKNGNNMLDDEERKNPSATKIGDYYLRFNPDGTCLYSSLKFKAIYEVKTEKGAQEIYIHAGDPRRFKILSLNENEIVVMPSGGQGTFFVYKRL